MPQVLAWATTAGRSSMMTLPASSAAAARPASQGDKKALKGETAPSNEQIAFAALMRGVHW